MFKQKKLSQNLCERNWPFEGFVFIVCSPALARHLQGLGKLSYLIVPSFLELIVYRLISCEHDEAWDDEIENGQCKKECNIVPGKGEEMKKRKEAVNSSLGHFCTPVVTVHSLVFSKLPELVLSTYLRCSIFWRLDSGEWMVL